MSEIAKILIEIQRENNAAMFDLEWMKNHIPTADRLVKVNGLYEIKDCIHCIEFYSKLKRI